jgi:hypothetical protein
MLPLLKHIRAVVKAATFRVTYAVIMPQIGIKVNTTKEIK